MFQGIIYAWWCCLHRGSTGKNLSWDIGHNWILGCQKTLAAVGGVSWETRKWSPGISGEAVPGG